MNHIFDNKERERILKARESYSGRLLTDNQFDEIMSITGIMEKEIRKSGMFKQKLGDYAYAYARTEKLNAPQAEVTIRELFKARCGQSMNQMRESIMAREDKLLGRNRPSSTDKNAQGQQEPPQPQISEPEKQQAYQAAMDIGQMIQEGDKIAFYRAYTHKSSALAQDLGITETGAKILIKEQFEQAESRDLYDWGKEMEEKYYRPQIKAEQDARQAKKEQSSAPEKKPAYQRSR